MRNISSNSGNNTTTTSVSRNERMTRYTVNFCLSGSGNTYPRKEYFDG